MSVYARGCSESQRSSSVLMLRVCRWMRVRVRSRVGVYLCLMGRLMEETRGSELCPIGCEESADPGTSMSRASPLFLQLFFFFFLPSLPASLSLHLSHLCLRPAFLLLIIDLLEILSLFPQLFLLCLCSFSPFISFHIYSSPPPSSSSSPSLPTPSLPVCG